MRRREGRTTPYDVVVIGLGLAGLVAALAAADRGARTLVVGRGWGTLRFRPGTIDVRGYWEGRPVGSPAAALAAVAQALPEHPYALAGQDLPSGVAAVRSASEAAGLALEGSLERNQLVATAAGTLRPACLVTGSMRADWSGAHLLVVGLAGYRDFQAELVSSVLPAAASRCGIELTARAHTIDLPSLHRRHLGSQELARAFEQPTFRREVIAAARGSLAGASLVALPAVLGLEGAAETAAELTQGLGVPVVELATLPPSVPGMRLELALSAALRRAGAVLQVGPRVRLVTGERRVEWVELDAPGHPLRIPVGTVVLATGGLASGGLEIGLDGEIRETVAGLQVASPEAAALFGRAFLEPGGHPVGRAGVRVDGGMRPLGQHGEPVFANLFAGGGLLAHADRAVELSADGIGSATGWRAGTGAAA
jgi:glycerol-3-phosphate dehydrogenase subunit B